MTNGEETTEYELICEFVHCKGPVRVVVGTVDTEAAALHWVAEQQSADADRLRQYDPNCDCPVAFCAMRGQPPRFKYRKRTP